MTFQEAQTKFSQIVGSITQSMSADEVLKRQRELISLQESLPISTEFDVISRAIKETSPRLTSIITQDVAKSLQSRVAVLRGASDLLTKVENEADNDARTLSLEEPKLIAAALSETVARLKELDATVKAGNFEEAASNVDALVTMIQRVQNTIKQVS